MGALEGIRVVDVGLLVQGPQAGQTLRDLGAEVIKVELPGLGDMARWIPISMEDLRTPYFEACNRGKKSISVDLRIAEGANIFRKLVDTADVLVANFKPGTLEAWGLSYEALSKSNPGLIYAMGSTFGPEGKDTISREQKKRFFRKDLSSWTRIYRPVQDWSLDICIGFFLILINLTCFGSRTHHFAKRRPNSA